MIDTSIVRVHQHAACIARNRSQSMGRSPRRIDQQNSCSGGHERATCPSLTAGEAHDNRLALSTFISPEIGINAAG